MVKKLKITGIAVSMFAFIALNSCNLDTKVYDRASAEDFPKTEAEFLSTVSGAYSALGGYNWAPFEINGPSSDEVVVPTRGPDWDDQGSWRQLETHSWTPDRPGQINGAWEFAYGGIVNANLALARLKASTLQLAGKDVIVAEVRALRAFYYYVLCDFFGNVPIITEDTPAGNPQQNTRQQVFSFVESELKAAIPVLRKENSQDLYGRVTQGTANAILAKLYINAQVFTGTPRWSETIATCDAIINSGQYRLNPSFFDNFSVGNRNSAAARAENMFIIPYDKVNQGGNIVQYRTLHYGQQATYRLASSPWNGFCTIAEFYNSFPDNDIRKRMWLVGPQPAPDGSTIRYNDAVTGESNVPLIFDPEVGSLTRASQRAGARSQKLEIQVGNNVNDQDNHFPIIRYADVLMMKAEAAFRLGQVGVATPLVNEIRRRAGLPEVTSLTLDMILAERGREFAWEGHRRNDLIRFDRFANGAWQFKPRSASKHVELLPIPTQQLARNPNLKQNPGY
jgi:starch-binding outer membrane protein, SusD/RagB family